jgi:hypothetical protein
MPYQSRGIRKRKPPKPFDPNQVAFHIIPWCRASGFHRTTVYRFMDKGILDWVQIGGSRMITESPAAFIQKMKEQQAAKTANPPQIDLRSFTE